MSERCRCKGNIAYVEHNKSSIKARLIFLQWLTVFDESAETVAGRLRLPLNNVLPNFVQHSVKDRKSSVIQAALADSGELTRSIVAHEALGRVGPHS